MDRKAIESITIVVGLFLLMPAVTSASDDSSDPQSQWHLVLSAGAVSWGELQDLEPATGGEFRPLGFVFEISAHEYLKRWRSAEVYAGVDIGAFITDSDVPGIFENISQRGIFVTPSLKLRYRTAEKAYVDLMAGAGWYEIDFTELFCTPQCIELNEAHSANGFGGYIGIGTGIGRSLNAGLKLHFTEFGNATGLGSGAGSLGGPIVMFTVGWRILG